jgi:UbiA prenyltransferase family
VCANRLERSEFGLAKIAKGLALLIRLPNSFTAVSNILAAHVVVTAGQPLWSALVLTVLASLCFYHGGMVLNDCADYDEDKQARPNRPLPAGIISLRGAWCLGISLLIIGLLLAYSVGLTTLLIACALVAAILLYNGSPREGLIGCFAMGGCRVLNWCLGLSVVSHFVVFWPYALLVGIYVMALTMISRDETTAEKPQWLVYCGTAMVLGALLFAVSMWHQHALSWIGIGVLALGLAAILNRLITLKRQYTPEAIQSTVMFFVLGLIPLDAALVLIAGYPLTAIFIVLLFIPSRVLARKLYVT